MGKVLLIMFVLGTLCVSACGSVQNDENKVVQVDDKKVATSDIRTETLVKLQELKKQLRESLIRVTLKVSFHEGEAVSFSVTCTVLQGSLHLQDQTIEF